MPVTIFKIRGSTNQSGFWGGPETNLIFNGNNKLIN